MTYTEKDPDLVQLTKAELCIALIDALEKLHVAESALWWAERRGMFNDAPVSVRIAPGRVRACVERHRAQEKELLVEVELRTEVVDG